MNTKILYLGLFILLMLLFILNISVGSVYIPFDKVIQSFSEIPSNSTYQYIILNFRLPKAIVAVLTGISLSISGLLMQNLFKNPLAGPYVLGITSGATLGVAILILGAGLLPFISSGILISEYSIVLASAIGSLMVLTLVIYISEKLRDTMSILIIGLMFGSISSAIVSVLSYFSSSEQLKRFTVWGLGNIGNQSWNTIFFIFILVLLGLLLSFLSIKSLNAFLLGDNYARSIGVNVKKTRLIIIIATSILAGGVTAFVGPIAFIGLAVPHLAKLLTQSSDHRKLFWITLLIGASLMLLCDTIAQMPGFDFILPINAVTSIIGAPIVIWLLLRKKKLL